MASRRSDRQGFAKVIKKMRPPTEAAHSGRAIIIGFLAAVAPKSTIVEVDELRVGCRQREAHGVAAGGTDWFCRRS